MEKVTGIGGLFFRARDPAALGRWYQEHLGVSLTPSSYEELPWRQEAGPTAFSPFLEASEYFGDSKQCGWSTFAFGTSTPWRRSSGRRISGSTWTRSITRMAALPACTILKAIRSSYGNPRRETLQVRLPSKRSPSRWWLRPTNKSAPDSVWSHGTLVRRALFRGRG